MGEEYESSITQENFYNCYNKDTEEIKRIKEK
jgi:hypothetical protein